MPKNGRSLVWLRRDLRLEDHKALHHAHRTSTEVFVVFVFDTQILNALLKEGLVYDRRVDFIHQSLQEIDTALRAQGSRLIVRHGEPQHWIPTLAKMLEVQHVYTHKDYEPLAIERDRVVSNRLKEQGCGFESFKDHVVFEGDEVLTQAGTPFSVFTPYKNAWLKKYTFEEARDFTVASNQTHYAPVPAQVEDKVYTLKDLGFQSTDIHTHTAIGNKGAHTLLKKFNAHMGDYDTLRNFPAKEGTSQLSMHLRMGTVSIRTLLRALHPYARSEGRKTWLSELVWREFYSMLLQHHPRLAKGDAFKPAYNAVVWRKGASAEHDFQRWCQGTTGYPFVDAGMFQLNTTGFMHNRLRMVTASFLVKDLGIDWHWGERYFAQKLNDFDLASNNGGWQWCASSGCDAQPYFRIFNPITQSKTYDPDGTFIRTHVPPLKNGSAKHIHAPWENGVSYIHPMVDHAQARLETLSRYKKAGV
jgi:deoxyribodipyrimidine photo-lyase